MSCDTLSSQALQFAVSVGSLPEGYCPETYQAFAQAIADRLVVSTPENISVFVAGDTEPASNIGPWFKDCTEWWYYDDATGQYRPVSVGYQTYDILTGAGTYVVPAGVYRLYVEAWGGGGGGLSSGYGGAGGGGAYGSAKFTVTPGQNIAYTVGSGGAAGNPASAGGNTSFSTLTCNGGGAGLASQQGGAGGSVAGADFGIPGQAGLWGSMNTGDQKAGVGGAAGRGGPGGSYTSASFSTSAGSFPGGGGSGSHASVHGGIGGAGANGSIIVWR